MTSKASHIWGLLFCSHIYYLFNLANASVLNLGLGEYCYYCLEYELLEALWHGKESQNKLGLWQVCYYFRESFLKMHSDLSRIGVGVIKTLTTSSQSTFLNELIIKIHHQEWERCGSAVPCLRALSGPLAHTCVGQSASSEASPTQLPHCFRQLQLPA